MTPPLLDSGFAGSKVQQMSCPVLSIPRHTCLPFSLIPYAVANKEALKHLWSAYHARNNFCGFRNKTPSPGGRTSNQAPGIEPRNHGICSPDFRGQILGTPEPIQLRNISSWRAQLKLALRRVHLNLHDLRISTCARGYQGLGKLFTNCKKIL
jgi:hypothetical protein